MPRGGHREGAGRKTAFAYPEFKKCAKCKLNLPGTSFYVDTAVNRLSPYCKECKRAYRRSKYDLCKVTDKDRFNALRRQAHRRGLKVTLSFEDFCSFRQRPCAYGGGCAPEFRIGIDRKDSEIGYTPSNCVPSCCRHNEIKRHFFTYKEMLLIASTVKSASACGNKILATTA